MNYTMKEGRMNERALNYSGTVGMMINHSTLEYHVTNFHTFSRWLLRTIQNSNPLL